MIAITVLLTSQQEISLLGQGENALDSIAHLFARIS